VVVTCSVVAAVIAVVVEDVECTEKVCEIILLMHRLCMLGAGSHQVCTQGTKMSA